MAFSLVSLGLIRVGPLATLTPETLAAIAAFAAGGKCFEFYRSFSLKK
jgi:hypothetical protein